MLDMVQGVNVLIIHNGFEVAREREIMVLRSVDRGSSLDGDPTTLANVQRSAGKHYLAVNH